MKFPFPLQHEVPLFLAPMAGVSEAPFRQIARSFGADVVVSEFISSVGVSLGIERVLAEMRFEEVERPIGIQLYGADAATMARAAALVAELFRPDYLDINFGCPVKKVVRNNGGSGCLKDMGLVGQIIRAVRQRDASPGDGEDPQRVGRSAARSGDDRAALSGRGRPGAGPAPADPDPDVQRAPPTGTRSPAWSRRSTSRSSATETSAPPRTCSRCGATPAAPAS